MALLTVFCVLGLFFALSSAQAISCSPTQTKVTLLDVGAGAKAWKYQFGGVAPTNWFNPTFDDSAWPSAALPYSTNPSLYFSCQNVTGNDCLPAQLTLTENIQPVNTNYPHFLRNTFTLTNPATIGVFGIEVVHDDAVSALYINGVNTSLSLPGYHCSVFSTSVSDVSSYGLVAGTNSIALQWLNSNLAAYLHLRLVACMNPAATPSPSVSKFPESGADPYFQDSHGHGFYANTEGLMLLCKTGRYTLQGHAVAACNASFLMSTTVWENETIPLSPECTRVKLQAGEAEQIGHAMLGNPYSVIRKEFCVAEEFKYTVYYVQVKPCGLVTQYLRIYDDCEEGWMSHKTYELYQYFSALEE